MTLALLSKLLQINHQPHNNFILQRKQQSQDLKGSKSEEENKIDQQQCNTNQIFQSKDVEDDIVKKTLSSVLRVLDNENAVEQEDSDIKAE